MEVSELTAIDAFCAAHKGIDNLTELAGFLRERFALELTLDADIVDGFAVDCSNLSGARLCRAR